jgi:tetraacyldisaccharide 4'-kinase
MLPRGRLREPASGLARADCVVITRAELAGDLEGLRREVARLSGGRAAVVTSRVRTRGLTPLGGDGVTPLGGEGVGLESRVEGSSALDAEGRSASDAGGRSASEAVNVGSPVAAFCAVGNPRAFFEQLRREGFELCHARAFPDHYAYKAADAEALSREAVARGARGLLTTAKDAVKLRGFGFGLPCYVVEMGLEFDDEAALLGLLRGAVSAAS